MKLATITMTVVSRGYQVVPVNVWDDIQKRIWKCEKCVGNCRVQLANRQKTPAPTVSVRLLLVGIAPPHNPNAGSARIVAKSATNDPDDNLRTFVTETLCRPWDDLVAMGLFLIHSTKCAIVPDKDGYQDPPVHVVDLCSPQHFAAEFEFVNASQVVAFGRKPLRVILSHPSVCKPKDVTRSTTIGELIKCYPSGISCKLMGFPFTLHVAYFPSSRDPNRKQQTALILKRAAHLAGLSVQSVTPLPQPILP